MKDVDPAHRGESKRGAGSRGASTADVRSRVSPGAKPQAVGDLIPRVLDEMGLGPSSVALSLLRVWDTALGDEFAPHCQLDGIRRGVIHARVRDSAWMQRLQLEKPRILARIEESLGSPIAQDLRLRIGSLD
jgi:predicted nucleic acid-binding Zn ribbon protein